jgi:cytochrome c oxidase subunit 2
MQSYKDQLSDEEIAAITTYERNAWGNNTEDTVQPKAVAARRQNTQKPSTAVNQAQTGGSQ